MIKDAFEIRNNSDYEDMYIASREQTEGFDGLGSLYSSMGKGYCFK